jgi:hypothetical protein
MWLERIETLPQGTPVFEVETGYKDCKVPGSYLAYFFADKLVCPGCKRTCRLPASACSRGDRIIVRKRPKKEGV